MQLAVLPDRSVAVLVTVFVPFGNVEPEGGLLTTVTVPQLSVAVTLKLTTAEHWPGSVPTTMLLGQVITGGTVSPAVKVAWAVASPLPAHGGALL